MTEIVNTATIRVVADASGVEAGLRSATEAAQRTQASVSQIGAGAASSARNVEAAQRNIVAAIQRTTTAMESGGKTTAAYYEAIARQRGIDPAALAPYIAQLRAAEQAQVRATQATAAQQAAAQQAADAVRVQAAAQRELAQAQATRDNFLAGLREQIALFSASTEEVLRYRAAEAGASQEASALILQLQNMRAAQEQVTQAARAQADAQRAAAQVQGSQDSFIASLRQEVEAIGKTRTELLELRAAQLGVTGQAQPFIEQLRASSRALGDNGMSANAMAAALRQVPAQLTDIIVGLQGGQAPITVLLQQGGQLRDMFGSVGGAAKALGGAVLGLINPYTIAIGVAGALAYAYKVGHDESIEYGRAIALSGNLAGATSSQLGDMARGIAQVTGSQHEAAAALVALVSTSAVANANLERFGTVAVGAQHVLGKAVADTVGEFAQLGQTPLSALQSIDEKYHFITASIYEQVKAAQEQGRTIEAASLAQNAYADGIDKRRQQVLDSLSDWERGWIRIKTATSGALDAAIDFAMGRQDTNTQKINALLDAREKIQEELNRAQARGLAANVAAYQAELDANQRDISAIRDKDTAKKKTAETDAAAVRAEELRKKWIDDQNILLTRQQLLKRDLAAAETEGKANGLSDEEIQNRLLVIRRKYNDVYEQGIATSITSLSRRAELEAAMDQRALAQIKAQQSLGNISDSDAINQTAKVELDALTRQKALLQDQLALVRTKINSQKEQADLSGQIAIVGVQQRSREKQQENDLLILQQQRLMASKALYASGIIAATSERDSLTANVEAQFEYNQEIGLSKLQLADLKAARLENQAALKDESAAALEAIEPNSELAKQYRDQAQSLRDLGDAMVRGANKEQRIDLWKQSVDQYNQVFQQGFADMLNNGQAGWSSFTKSLVTTFKTTVADQIYKMFAQPIIVQLVGSYMGVSQTAIAGAIGAQSNAYGVTKDSTSPIGAAQAASTIYKAITGGFTALSTGVADAVQAGLYSSGLTTQIASNGALASGVGTAVGVGAGALAGYGLGTAISGQYGSKATVVGGTAAGAALGTWVFPGLGTALGAALGGTVGGLLNRAFGMGDKEVTGQGISGTLTATNLTGQNYTKWHQDGGWFRSDNEGTDTSALSTAMVSEFTQGLSSIETASSGFAKSLGVSADWITDYSKTFDIKLTGDATTDQQAITDFFNGVGDEIANKLVPNLASFTKTGETASATLERLAGDFKGTDQVAQLLGVSATALFGSSGLGSASARENLIDIAGGLDALNSSASSFNQNFLTDAERLKPVADALDTALGSLGLSTIPTTRAAFKDLINTLIASGAAATEAGAQQLDSLLNLSDAFAQVHPDTSDADAQKAAAVLQERQGLQDQLDQLTMTSAQLLAKQRDALDDSNKSLFDQVQAATAAAAAIKAQADAIDAMKTAASNLLGGVDSAFSTLQSVVQREKDALQDRIDAENDLVTKLQSMSDSVHSALDSMSVPGAEAFNRQAAQAQIRAAAATVQGGGSLSDADTAALTKALSTVSQDSTKLFGSKEDYLFDYLTTRNDIAQLGGATDDQLTTAEAQLKSLQDQSKSLDDMLAKQQEAIDVLKGASTTGISIDQALHGIAVSIASALQNPVVSASSAINNAYQSSLGRAPDQAGLTYWQEQAAAGASTSDIVSSIKGSMEAQINGLYQSLFDRPADAAGLSYWLGSGETISQIKGEMMTSDEYKKLHPFAVGTNEVPDTMAALIHKGERIVPAADNRALMARLANPAENSSALADAVKSLTATVATLQSANEEMAKDMSTMADALKGASPGGNFLRVKVVQ